MSVVYVVMRGCDTSTHWCLCHHCEGLCLSSETGTPVAAFTDKHEAECELAARRAAHQHVLIVEVEAT